MREAAALSGVGGLPGAALSVSIGTSPPCSHMACAVLLPFYFFFVCFYYPGISMLALHFNGYSVLRFCELQARVQPRGPRNFTRAHREGGGEIKGRERERKKECLHINYYLFLISSHHTRHTLRDLVSLSLSLSFALRTASLVP